MNVIVAVLLAVLLIGISGAYMFGVLGKVMLAVIAGVLLIAPAVSLFISIIAPADSSEMDGASTVACLGILLIYGSAYVLFVEEESTAAYILGAFVFWGIPAIFTVCTFV